MAITWDATFEGLPEATVEDASGGADRITDFKKAVDERLDREHNFKAGSIPYHKAGLCPVLKVGDTATIAALDGEEGCFAYDTTLNTFKVYTDSAWTAIGGSHSRLKGLVYEDDDPEGDYADDHPQYVMLTKEGQTLLQDLACSAGVKIDGRDLSVDALRVGLIPTDTGFGDLEELTCSLDTIYGPETKDCMLNITVSAPTTELGGTASAVIVYVGKTSPPTTIQARGFAWYQLSSPDKSWGTLQRNGMTAFIPKGYYWKISIFPNTGPNPAYWLTPVLTYVYRMVFN